MKKIIAILVVMFALIATQAYAQTPGDVGTGQCYKVQLAAQQAVSDGGPYKNHGALVRTAAAVVSSAEFALEITAECSSCIMNQFARGIPIEEQAPCGSECEGQTCGYFTPDCNADIQPCFCFKKVDGSGACVDTFYCETPCATDADCPTDQACYIETCCEQPYCGPTTCTGAFPPFTLIQSITNEVSTPGQIPTATGVILK